jgi:hypothetical protein
MINARDSYPGRVLSLVQFARVLRLRRLKPESSASDFPNTKLRRPVSVKEISHWRPSICAWRNARTESTLNNLLPRIRPRRRRETPLIAPSASNWYARLRLMPNARLRPSTSMNSGSICEAPTAASLSGTLSRPSCAINVFTHTNSHTRFCSL